MYLYLSLSNIWSVTITISNIQGPGTVFNPEKKTEVFHEAKYKVFLQMGQHQREYRYHQFAKPSS